MNFISPDHQLLMDQVIELWESHGYEYLEELSFFGEVVTDGAWEILQDPMKCVDQLGFDSLSQYCASMNEKYPHNQDAISYFIGGAK